MATYIYIYRLVINCTWANELQAPSLLWRHFLRADLTLARFRRRFNFFRFFRFLSILSIEFRMGHLRGFLWFPVFLWSYLHLFWHNSWRRLPVSLWFHLHLFWRNSWRRLPVSLWFHLHLLWHRRISAWQSFLSTKLSQSFWRPGFNFFLWCLNLLNLTFSYTFFFDRLSQKCQCFPFPFSFASTLHKEATPRCI